MIAVQEIPFDISSVAMGIVALVTIAAIVGIVWLINQLGTITRFIKEVAGVRDPQAVDVSGSVETTPQVRMATWEELQDVKASVKDIEVQLADGLKALTLEGSRRAASIHGRVDKVAVELAGVKATGEATHSGQILLGQKVDNLIMELRRESK